MTIQFADPGYNWAFVWWPLGVLGLAVALAIFLASIDLEDILGPILGIPIAAMLIVPTLFGVSFYGVAVDSLKQEELIGLGFSHVALYGGNRFTAATPDGQFFSGILVDLRPDSGYAYQVLEITDTPTK